MRCVLGRMQATMEWEAQDEGVLAKILVGDGAQDVKVGTPVAIIVDDKADVRCPFCISCHDKP